MNKIKFLDAMAFVARYFKPLHLQASLHRPLIVTIEIKDPDTELFVKIKDYPAGTALSCGAIMELIANIEAQVEKHTRPSMPFIAGEDTLFLAADESVILTVPIYVSGTSWVNTYRHAARPISKR